jgi:hypothetical protein
MPSLVGQEEITGQLSEIIFNSLTITPVAGKELLRQATLLLLQATLIHLSMYIGELASRPVQSSWH